MSAGGACLRYGRIRVSARFGTLKKGKNLQSTRRATADTASDRNHIPMDAVLSNEHILTYILQSVSGERRKLEKRIAELNAKEIPGSMDATSVAAARIDLVFALKHLYPDRILQLMLAKPVCRFWRRVCRQALTDPEWNHADIDRTLENMMLCQNVTWRLPLRCTLHPRLCYFDDCSAGFFDGNSSSYKDSKPGNPCNSVFGTLRDLQVRVVQGEFRNTLEIVRINLEVDGLEGSFDSVWSPLASKFRLTRDDLYFDNPRDFMYCELNRKHELHFIDLGHVLQNRYWTDLGTICGVLHQAHHFHSEHPDWVPEQLPIQILPMETARNSKHGRRMLDCGPGLLRMDGSPCIVP